MASVIVIFESVIFWFIIAILFAVVGAALFNTYRRNCSDLRKGKKKYSIAIISDTIAGHTGNDGVVLTKNTSSISNSKNINNAPTPASLADLEKIRPAQSLISIYIPSRNESITSLASVDASSTQTQSPVSV